MAVELVVNQIMLYFKIIPSAASPKAELMGHNPHGARDLGWQKNEMNEKKKEPRRLDNHKFCTWLFGLEKKHFVKQKQTFFQKNFSFYDVLVLAPGAGDYMEARVYNDLKKTYIIVFFRNLQQIFQMNWKIFHNIFSCNFEIENISLKFRSILSWNAHIFDLNFTERKKLKNFQKQFL